MPRSIAIIAALLLLTGWIGWQAISLGTTKPLTMREVQASPALIAALYYDAVNETLTTGDSASLRLILHPRFIDHLPSRQEPGTAEDLLASLLEIRMVFPDLRIAASETVAHGSVAVSSVGVSGGRQGHLGQIPVLLEAQELGYETLLIDDGLVMARWSSIGLTPSPQLLAHAVINPLDPAISVRTPRLERFFFDQFARIDIPGHVDAIVIVESGLLQLNEKSASGTVAPNTRQMLTAGQAVTLSVAGSVELLNPGRERAIALLLVIPPFDPPRETGYVVQPDPLPGGITRELRVEGPPIPAAAGSVAITMCLIRIAPGVSISNSGATLLFVHEGAVEVLGDGDRRGREADGAVLSAGRHLSRDAGTTISIRATGSSKAAMVLVNVDQATVRTPAC